MSELSRPRDSMGRFLTGGPGGPGRKPRDREMAYLVAMESIVDDQAWLAIVERAVLDAKNGDAKARSWLSGYLMGMPVSRSQEVDKVSPIEEALARWVEGKRQAAEQLKAEGITIEVDAYHK